MPPHLLICQCHGTTAGGEPLSPGYLIRSTPTALPFGLHNAAETDDHPVAEFVGVTEYVAESFHDLLAGEAELPYDSDSSKGSHHPSRECFMAGTLRDMSKASTKRRLPRQTTLTMRLRWRQGPTPPVGGAAEGLAPRA